MNYRFPFKVRGFQYDTDRGLLLIQTEKSKMHNLWTTIGGSFNYRQNSSVVLTQIIFQETGIDRNFVSVDTRNFYDFPSVIRSNKKPVRIFAHWMNMNHPTLNYDEGKFPSGTPFKFFQIEELLANERLITLTTSDIIHNKVFRNRIDQLNSTH